MSKGVATRPKTARPATNGAARPVTAKVRPATAKVASQFDESSINPYIQEIQNKLKSPDFAPSLSDPNLMDFIPSSPGGRGGQKKVPIGLLEEKLPDPTPQTAHKRYASVYPCSSKLLAKKWDDATWKKHKEKIKTMKACIDNVHSVEKPSTLRSLKKSIAKQENEKRIARENEILLERMARTFTKPSAFTNFEGAHARTKKDLEHKSKAYLRKREQANEKIDKENEILLKRLQNKRANYEKKQWMVERREHLRHLLNMTKFPEAYQTAVKREHLFERKKSPVGHILKYGAGEKKKSNSQDKLANSIEKKYEADDFEDHHEVSHGYADDFESPSKVAVPV